ncbi:GTPase IMAP family member 9 isoform X2 [Patella vulgata]|uniref:GTPase IMAP family member 9 isoform X2 n=1 Tax=Patella vulgata TaxID=6465 RepID=UPI00217F5025|nr:GTPase IMAP family member 9 isoform X2 [Patella vulgata]
MATGGSQEIKLILVGSKGMGKSSVGNSLLNSDAFKSRSPETSSLVSCYMAATQGYGANLLLVDTSGIIDNCDNPLSHQMVSSINISAPVIFAIIIKLKYQYTYTPDELEIGTRLKRLFGKNVMNNALVVFTEKEMLEHDGLTLDDYIRKSPDQLQQLMKECNSRVAVINNHENISNRQQDVMKILTIAEGIKLSHHSKISSEVKHMSDHPEIRLILIGNKRAGKSSLGNSLLQRKAFTALSPEDIQGSIQLADGTKIVIVDTPGIADPKTPTINTFEELTRRVELLHPGPHVFIMVLTIDRFTQEDVDAIKYIKYWFGEDITRYLVVVFTGKDSLDYHEQTLETHIQKSREELKSLISECNGRVTAINNRDSHPGIKAVFDLVQQTIKDNKDGFYNQEMYTNAVKERQGKPNVMDTDHFSKQKDLRLRALEEKQAKELEAKEKELL